MDETSVRPEIHDINDVIGALKAIELGGGCFGEIIATPADMATAEGRSLWISKFLVNSNTPYGTGLSVQRLLQAIMINLDGVVINASKGSIIPAAARALSSSGYTLETAAAGNTKLLISIVTPIGKIVIYEHDEGLKNINKYFSHVDAMRTMAKVRKLSIKEKFTAICQILMA